MKQKGFTIVELLIVIVVIAVLAAITIVAYNGISERARDTTINSDLQQLAKKFETTRVTSSTDSFPSTNPVISGLFTVAVSKDAYRTTGVSFNLVVCSSTSSNSKDFVIIAASKSGKVWWIRNGGGVLEYTGAGDPTNSNSATYCSGFIPGWSAIGAGYSVFDTTTGPWRAWAGGN